MYPYAAYIRYAGESKITTVSIESYQQHISANAFRNLNLTVPYNLSKQVKTNQAYSFVYKFEYRLEECNDVSEISDPIPLYEFYKSIGYEKTTKKFNGLTLRQHILQRLDNTKK